jgi:hypothetical protein
MVLDISSGILSSDYQITKTQEHDGLQDKRHIIEERRLRRRHNFKRRITYFHLVLSTRHDPLVQSKDDAAKGDQLLKYAVTLECTTTSDIKGDGSGMFPPFRCDEYAEAAIDPASRGHFISYDGKEAPVSHPRVTSLKRMSSYGMEPCADSIIRAHAEKKKTNMGKLPPASESSPFMVSLQFCSCRKGNQF